MKKSIRRSISLLLILFLLGGQINASGYQHGGRVPTAHGIDVSHHQGVIDWDILAPEIDFAILRCGYGADRTSQDDRQWFANANACTRLKIPFGVYIYSHATTKEEALDEARHVLRLVKGYELSMPIYYDLEDDRIRDNCTKEEILENTRVFCNAIEAAGYEAGIYANTDWWKNLLTSPEYDQWDRWVARYSNATGYSGSYSMWQYTSEGVLPGITANTVDLNFWYGPKPGKMEFKDVSSSDWFAPAVDFVVENNLFQGMGNDRFEPNTPMTRAMLVTVLWRQSGERVSGTSGFADVAQGQWYSEAVLWAVQRGIVKGVGGNRFAPEEALTREQLAAILYRYCESYGIFTGERGNLSTFSDGGTVSQWAQTPMSWAVARGLLYGTAVEAKLLLAPLDTATRAQVATILMRFLEK